MKGTGGRTMGAMKVIRVNLLAMDDWTWTKAERGRGGGGRRRTI